MLNFPPKTFLLALKFFCFLKILLSQSFLKQLKMILRGRIRAP